MGLSFGPKKVILNFCFRRYSISGLAVALEMSKIFLNDCISKPTKLVSYTTPCKYLKFVRFIIIQTFPVIFGDVSFR